MTQNKVSVIRCRALWMGFLMCASLQAGLSVQEEPTPDAFPLVCDGEPAALITDANDFDVVQVAALGLVRDVLAVTNVTPQLLQALEARSSLVIIGTVGRNRWIDQLVEAEKLDVTDVAGQWETSVTAMVSSPFDGVDQALVIAGSDRRGTAFGVFELSRQIGVSPWIWWADVRPAPKEALYVTVDTAQLGPPSVKYRGIFIGDEDWGLHPWAASHMDRDIGGIGPNTYARIFELLLRLKANYLWPATRPCTEPFYFFPDNVRAAHRYAMVVGDSHYDDSLARYDRLNLPEAKTVMWTDDNHGYISQLPTPAAYKQHGASGVYYHLSGQGAPEDYLWLCSTSPALISMEMSKAYAYGATRLWVFNVGDIKPAEMEMEFSLDLAWDVNAWPPDKAHTYGKAWATRAFGDSLGEHVARIKQQYYRLAASARPEHVALVPFSPEQTEERIRAYEAVTREAQFLYSQVPKLLKDAYFQLVLYPVKGACLMNLKHLYARRSLDLAKQGDKTALEFSTKARQSHALLQSLTVQYNQIGGSSKWDGIMSPQPRDRQVFVMPDVATEETIAGRPQFTHRVPSTVIAAAEFSVRAHAQDSRISVVDHLGIEGSAISRFPVTGESFDQSAADQAPYVEYHTQLQAGMRLISVRCVPTHRIHQGRHLTYGIQVNQGPIQFRDVNAATGTPTWSRNVLQGYSQGQSLHNVDGGDTTIRLYLLDTGLTISRIVIE